MNKARLENLSDAVFAIVLTLLVIDIKIPETDVIHTTASLVAALREIGPTMLEFFLSFIVLTMFWIGHNFLYSVFTKSINRVLIVLNLTYLAFISLIPFSARVLDTYREIPLAVMVYGVNVFLIGLLNIIIFKYALYSDDVDTEEVSSRLIKQANIRLTITPFFALIGIGVANYSTEAAFVFYALPIIFNVLPGTLNALERLFGFELK
jgi:uncharacterized membrane protein